METIKIVSRKSKLALWQANFVAELIINKFNYDVEIIPISTKGDEILDLPLNKIGGKGLFVKELEKYLLLGKADLAVHSLKDMPADLHENLKIGAILDRNYIHDVFVSRHYKSLSELKEGAVVGTSSLRRRAQLLAIRPDLEIKGLRGNINTRLKKLQSGEFDSIILAEAGLKRLGYNENITQILPIDTMLPAIGQGALSIEYNKTNKKISEILSLINNINTYYECMAERKMNSILDGGCHAPIAGYAKINNSLSLTAIVASEDGKVIIRSTMNDDDPTNYDKLGTLVANDLLNKGADILLQNYRSNADKVGV